MDNFRNPIKAGLTGVKGIARNIRAKRQAKKTAKANVKKMVKAKPTKRAGDELLLPLKPFEVAINEGLTSKGVSIGNMTFENKVNRFFNEFVSKKGDPTSQFDEIPSDCLEKDLAFQVDSVDFDNVDPATIGAVITGTFGFLKKQVQKRKAKKAAKKAGKKPPVETAQTKSEEKIAEQSERIINDLNKKSENEEPMKKGSMKIYLLIGLVVVAIVGYMLMKK